MKLLEALIEIIERLIRVLFNIAAKGFDNLHSEKKTYSSRFVPTGEILVRNPTGLNLTGRYGLTLRQAMQHCLIVGRSGSGKSVVTVSSELLSATERTKKAYLILDPSGELHARTSGHLGSVGFRVLKLDLGGAAGSQVRFNPLLRATTPTAMRLVANAVVQNALGRATGDVFWNSAACSLIASMFQLLHNQPDSQVRHLASAAHLLKKMQASPTEFDAYVSRFADDSTFDELKALFKAGDKLMASIVQTSRTALDAFSDPMVGAITSDDNVRFSMLKERTALFVQLPTMYSTSHLAVLLNLFLEQAFTELMSRLPEPTDYPLICLLDEFSSIRSSPMMPLVVQNARKYGICIAMFVQSEASLIEAYGKSDAITLMQNASCHMFFSGQDLATSKALEEILGRTEVEDDRGSKKIQPLLTRENVRTLNDRRAIIICGSKEPVMAKLTPYYRRRVLRKRSLIPPPVHVPDEVPFKLISLTEPYVEPKEQPAQVSGE
jgi:type IV secretory pathway TraG/TraD family ATPase VirD4